MTYVLENGLLCLDHFGDKYLGWVVDETWDVYHKRYRIEFETLNGRMIKDLQGNISRVNVPDGSLIVWNREAVKE